ncbi:MAG: GntR family transcriptional regulator [Clostridia bacterium]|nr:GntR family transcriptional regulator [Clostridia bacterium]MBQ2237716.1 GntR family transcriptional regulator [Clostridia bacterium]MEE1184549.1 GntR family transcriptional regulator [Acutalibacteraceae bacterium]
MIEHKTVSLADQVFDHLETDILSGKYSRGEILTESKLSQELGVSRTPIREALRRLEQEHIIEETGKGSVVIGISEKDVDDIFVIRKQLETLAAGIAAENCTDEQLSKLREALELQEFYLEKGDAEQIKQMDNRFHYIVYRLSGSTVFYDILVPLHKKIQKYRKIAVQSSGRAKASVEEHRKIYEAIASGNKALAEKYVLEHVENAYSHIKKRGQ